MYNLSLITMVLPTGQASQAPGLTLLNQVARSVHQIVKTMNNSSDSPLVFGFLGLFLVFCLFCIGAGELDFGGLIMLGFVVFGMLSFTGCFAD